MSFPSASTTGLGSEALPSLLLGASPRAGARAYHVAQSHDPEKSLTAALHQAVREAGQQVLQQGQHVQRGGSLLGAWWTEGS